MDYLDSSDFKEILKAYEQSCASGELKYFDTDDFSDIADYYLGQGMVEKGLEVVDNGLRIHADNEPLLMVKAGVLILLRRFDEAKRVVDSLRGNDNELLCLRAQIAYAADNDTVRSEELFRRWIESEERIESSRGDKNMVDENMRNFYLRIMFSYLDLAFFKDDDILKAWIDEYIDRFSPLGNSDCDLSLAEVCCEAEYVDYIIKVYSLLLETDPYIKSGWVILATAQYTAQKYTEAIESADFAIAINPQEYDAILIKARSYYLMSEYELALENFEICENMKRNPECHLEMGKCLMCVGRTSEAIACLDSYRESLKVSTQQKKEEVCSMLSNLNLNVDALESAGLFEGYNIDAMQHYDLAATYRLLDVPEKALEEIDVALSKYPLFADFLAFKGTLLIEKYNDSKGGMEYIRQALDHTNNQQEIYFYIGRSFVHAECYEAALQVFLLILAEKDDKRSVEANAYLSFIYLHLGEPSLFLRYLKTACECCPNTAEDLFSSYFPGVAPHEYYNNFVARYRGKVN